MVSIADAKTAREENKKAQNIMETGESDIVDIVYGTFEN